MELEERRTKESQFKVISYISSGTFGTVEKCQSLKNNKIYAVKSIHNVRAMEVEKIEQEVLTMIKANSNYTLELIDHFFEEDQQTYILVLPFCKMGCLASKMKQTWKLDELLLFLLQICQGFLDINEGDIWHLDLKPENILIKAPNQYVICDFGCARNMDNGHVSNMLKLSMSKGIGTTEYGAPELITDCQGCKHSDMWSLGIILYKILYHKHPIEVPNNGTFYSQLMKLVKGDIAIPYANIPGLQPVINMCKRMLIPNITDKSKRITWAELKRSICLAAGVKPTTVIPTNVPFFIGHLHNFSVLISALIHFIKVMFEIGKHATDHQIKEIGNLSRYKEVIVTGCQYLSMLIVESAAALKQQQHTSEMSFSLFSPTLMNSTKEQDELLFDTQRRKIRKFIQYSEVKCRSVSLSDSKSAFEKTLGNFRVKTQYYNDLLKKSPEYEWHKVEKIAKMILDGKILEYSKAKKLKEFCKDIINT